MKLTDSSSRTPVSNAAASGFLPPTTATFGREKSDSGCDDNETGNDIDNGNQKSGTRISSPDRQHAKQNLIERCSMAAFAFGNQIGHGVSDDIVS